MGHAVYDMNLEPNAVNGPRRYETMKIVILRLPDKKKSFRFVYLNVYKVQVTKLALLKMAHDVDKILKINEQAYVKHHLRH